VSNTTVKGWVSGKVQGVGFRYFVQRAAKKFSVNGYAKNLEDGRVEVLLRGEQEAVWEVKKAVLKGPLLSDVKGCEWSDETDIDQVDGFNCY